MIALTCEMVMVLVKKMCQPRHHHYLITTHCVDQCGRLKREVVSVLHPQSMHVRFSKYSGILGAAGSLPSL